MSISCQTKSEKRIEIATIDYIHFIDSVTEYKKEEAQKNCSEGKSEFEGKIDSATEKFESYRKAVFKDNIDPDVDLYLD